jgi:glycosyltransferase involved in cell wall biosynthesis
MSQGFQLHAIYPNFCSGAWNSYSLVSVLAAMRNADVRSRVYALGKARTVSHDLVSPLLPTVLYGHTHRLISRPCDAIVRRYRRRFRRGDCVYFWLESPVHLIRQLQRDGLFVAREMINCTRLRIRRELRAAYALLGEEYRGDITDEAIERERAELLAADAVFCSNEAVLESVRECGVEAARCIRTSYGWGRNRIPPGQRQPKSRAGVDVLFVGTGDIRKGLPWLLEAWDRAGISGRLLIAGVVHAEVKERCARLLARSDVRALGFVDDIASAYRSADIFCFPSWEEGGPMVTIEALASGLPCVVTPMGSAGVIRDSSQGGIIVQPGNVDELAGALRMLAVDEPLRRRLGEAARRTSLSLTWEQVGARRLEALLRIRAGRG